MISKFFKTVAENNFICLPFCFAAGIIGSLPFFFEGAFVLTFLSDFLLFSALLQRLNAKRRLFLPCLVFFMGYYIPVYSFLSELYPFERFGFSKGEAVTVLIAACFFIPLYHSALRSLVLLLLKTAPKNPALRSLAFASVWAVSEWILSVGTLAFPWGTTAVALSGFTPFIQNASLFGQYFISGITALICCLFAISVTTGNAPAKPFFAALSLFFVFTGVGTGLLISGSGETSNTFKAALLQGNIDSNDKWVDGNQQTIFNIYYDLAESAAKEGAEVIILPETAIPLNFSENGTLHSRFAKIATNYKTTVIMGVNIREGNVYYNSVIGILPDGTLTNRYDKRHLVPFGEFIPYLDLITEIAPFMEEFNEGMGVTVAGRDPAVLSTAQGDLGALVCFDSIFPALASDSVNNGAEAICIVTNDSWFEDSIGVSTHLRHAKLRAVESRKYVLRAANTGISAFIDPKGRIIGATEALTEDVIFADISTNSIKTLYSTVGDVILYVFMLIILFNFSVKTINYVRRRKNGKNPTS